MILKLWCKGTNKREDYNGINAEPLTLKYINYITYNEDEDTNIREKIDGKGILVLDDIISSGESVSQAVKNINDSFIPKSVTVITLLSKKF